MKSLKQLGRREFLLRAATGMVALPLAGCDDAVSQNTTVSKILDSAETVTRRVQKAITGSTALAPEYPASEISKNFRSNGTHDPTDPNYQALAKNGFADWRLDVGGLVERPMRFSLAELRALPSRTQITRHDCVEGWSCIGKWTGVPLATVLDKVGPTPAARYVVFYCADPMEQTLDGSDTRYYESIDLQGAHHPQTILAYEMNDETLQVPYGAPLRLRDERQLGYKMAKYIMRIALVDSFADIRGGKGGYWEDQGYEWYAGI
jgi:DMSO/TMAO reductase YedYZ molybdopterin-dependent catalytic subunit